MKKRDCTARRPELRMRQMLPPGRSFFPALALAAVLAVSLAGCKDDDVVVEPGGRPRVGEKAPELVSAESDPIEALKGSTGEIVRIDIAEA